MPLLPLCVQKPFNVNAVRCRPSTFGTIWISGGWTSRINFRRLPPLDLPGKTSGSIFFSPSSVRTPLWKEATLEKTLRMLSVNGKLRNCTFWIIKRMVFSSSHPPIFDWAEWTRRCRRLPDTEFDSLLATASETVVQEFLGLLTGFLHRTLSSQWVQSGLALSPLVATCTQYSVDFCLAWALIGEWTSRILFPVPKAPWPRHGHAGALLRQYQARSPRIVAWARATFEQGALPSLLFLQGLVPIFTLPGDKMFQATGLGSHRQRPPIMHAYGGAKSGMAQALQSIASEGWIPLAAAMVGTVGNQPLWADLGLRPVVGTTLDIKLGPRPLQHRDVALLLSCWKRWDFRSVADSAINTWLKGANTAYGPDCEDSPYFRCRNMDEIEAMRLFAECGFDFLPETDLQQRPGLEVVMTVGLHLCALELTDQQLDTLACIALSGQLP